MTDSKSTVKALAALAQESRLAIFRALVEAGPAGLSVGRIAESLPVAPATLSFHLKELSHAGLIDARQEGRFIFYCANFTAMNGLIDYLTENCCGSDASCCAPSSGATTRTRSAKPKARRTQ